MLMGSEKYGNSLNNLLDLVIQPTAKLSNKIITSKLNLCHHLTTVGQNLLISLLVNYTSRHCNGFM